ncbi:hypothetical protein ElyMa_000292200 [Elysia marginata]|uniref:Uncharacterized protein n=1 Tax=Elysia marginata TaxID=1093978 RepID=A0AAV4F8A1_9GAST|nr:hypothetical protein ElyMa_000292200 [Elysia marginata]
MFRVLLDILTLYNHRLFYFAFEQANPLAIDEGCSTHSLVLTKQKECSAHVVYTVYTCRSEYLESSSRGLGPVARGQRGGVISASDSRSEGRGFDSRPCHVAIALRKQFTLTFPSPPTYKMGTQRQASNVLVCWGNGGAALWRHNYTE